ncbi:PREDICTED: facilitated trehalose transporter Tret1-like [Ceratosolen solmsi marchali]|uniref:Facilitated trehalose transporter Tret1-like n=1 Tax=Ceratosolen solmsi marchali TaxID=326594 RepID=A0AAJ6YBK3_9HYME|nr:PREDICTED: facilitated trehalose transporter Tret1-like [Ceratosolen solmsi marchali]
MKSSRSTIKLNELKETTKAQEMEAAKIQSRSQRTQWKQWAACISATLSMVAAGSVYGWTTTIISRLTNATEDVPVHISMDESSWVISLTVIGSMIGPFYGAYVAASCGRKLCLLMSSLFYILGWLLVIFAQNVWYLYFSDSEELLLELEIVRKNIGENSDGEFDELKFSFADFLLLMSLRNRRALLIVMGLILGQQLSGNFSTMQYLEHMFLEAKIGIDSHMATIIVLAVGLVSGALSTLMVEGAGRRPLLIYSSFGLMVNASGADISSLNLLPVVDVIVFQVVYQIGLGTLPNLLIGELFPTNVKGIAGAIVTVFDGLLGFVVSKMYEVIFTNVGSHVTYLLFAVSCSLLFVFIYGFIPETKCKTFNEIQEMLGEMRPFKMTAADARCWPFKTTVKDKSEEA